MDFSTLFIIETLKCPYDIELNINSVSLLIKSSEPIDNTSKELLINHEQTQM